MFFNQVLPTSVGGDLYRIIEVSRLGYKKIFTSCAILTDRIYGTLGLVLIAILFGLLLPHTFPKKLNWLIDIITYGAILATIVLLFFNRIALINQIKVFAVIHQISKILSRSFSSIIDFICKIIISVCSNGLAITAVYFTAKSLHLDINLQYFFLIIPLVNLLTLVPISLAGWGIREGAMVSLFSFVGIEKSHILPASILYGILLIISSLPGLYFYLAHKSCEK